MLTANTVKVETGRAQTFLERETLAMLHRELFGQDDAFYDAEVQSGNSALGVVCSGGTIANCQAMWIARNNCMPPDGSFLGIDKQGIWKALKHYSYDGCVIIGSQVGTEPLPSLRSP